MDLISEHPEIGVALLWIVMLVSVGVILKGTPEFAQVIPLLVLGAIATVFLAGQRIGEEDDEDPLDRKPA